MIYDYITLDRTTSVPLCHQLTLALQKSIDTKRIQKNEKLPSIRMAAAELKVSRTTVESAYIQLCNKGYLESRPQSGYYVQEKIPAPQMRKNPSPAPALPVRYDFSSGQVASKTTDILLWCKQMRSALQNQADMLSYGNPQGEDSLRHAIAEYAYRTRGVETEKDSIIVGAGTQLLFMLFCSLYGKRGTVAMPAPGFKQAERIFRDYGFSVVYIDTEQETPLLQQLEESGACLYLDIPAQQPKRTPGEVKQHYGELLAWAAAKEERLILEDDYNGELRYLTRPLPALQQMNHDKVSYFGSFSKLLLPSVRIAYMVLPKQLMETYRQRITDYNPTVGKIEQLALAAYIQKGYLEKHLRRLRKLYRKKSDAMVTALAQHFPMDSISLWETSFSVTVPLPYPSKMETQEQLTQAGIKLDWIENQSLRLSFSGIPYEDIPAGIDALCRILEES